MTLYSSRCLTSVFLNAIEFIMYIIENVDFYTHGFDETRNIYVYVCKN